MSPDAQQRVFAEETKQEEARRIARAVKDVMDGDITLRDAAKNRGVSDVKVRAELTKRGWIPPHRDAKGRRRFGGLGRVR